MNQASFEASGNKSGSPVALGDASPRDVVEDAIGSFAADGVGVGAVFLRGHITVDESGPGLDGDFTYDQSSAAGRTVASGSGTLVGTALSG